MQNQATTCNKTTKTAGETKDERTDNMNKMHEIKENEKDIEK